MKKQLSKIALSRETLRILSGPDDLRGLGGGTYPDTMLPNHCRTASCHGICFAPETPAEKARHTGKAKAKKA